MQNIMNKETKERGFTALITVLIVSAITIISATTLIFLSISESLLGFSAAETHEAIQIADSCAEEALFRLKSNQTYSGGTITIGNGNCIVAITGSGGNGSARTIIATSTITTSIASFTRVITASSTMTTNTAGNATTTDIVRWRE